MDKNIKEKQKKVIARVVSSRPDKTVIAVSQFRVQHPIYKKFVKKETRYVVHDYKNEARSGDEIEILSSRPLSKTKRWVLMNVRSRETLSQTDEVI